MSTLPNMILPAAASDRFQSEASAVFPGQAEEGGEQFDRLMTRALLNPTGDKSPATGPSLMYDKTGTNTLALDSTGSKSTAPIAYPFATSNSVAANVNLFSGNTATTLASQTVENDGQLADNVMTRGALPLADGNNAAAYSTTPKATTATAASLVSRSTTPTLSTATKESNARLENPASVSLSTATDKNIPASRNLTPGTETPGTVKADDSPVEAKNPRSAAVISAAPAIYVSTVANVQLVSPAPTPGTSSKPGAVNGPVNRLAARTTLPATGNKNVSANPYSNRGKAEANHTPVVTAGLKPGTAVSSAAPANTLPVANNDLLLDGKIAAINRQTGKVDGQLEALINGAPPAPVVIKNPVTSQEPALIKTGMETVPVHAKDAKDSKAVVQTSGTSHSSVISAPDAAKSSINQPQISDPAANPVNITAQILAPMVAVSGLSVKAVATPPSGGTSTSGKAANILPVADNTSTSSAKITNPVAPQSQPMPEANPGDPRVQTDRVKKNPAYAGIEAYAKNNFVDAQTAGLTPAAGPISSAAKEQVKAVMQTLETSQGSVTSAPDAAKFSTGQLQISDPTTNPVNITAQILAPMAAISGLSVKAVATPPSGGTSMNGKAANILPVADNTSTSSAKTTSSVAPQSQPMPETGAKVQIDSIKKDPAHTGIAAYAKNNFMDAKTGALTPIAGPISSAAREQVTESVKTSDPAVKTTDDSQPTGLPPLGSADAKISAPMPSLMNGTPTAQQDELMSNGGKTTKTTDLTGKFLPGSVSVVARGNDLPGRADQFSATAAAGMSSNPLTATVSAADSVENFMMDDARAQTLERTHDLVAVHAMNVGSTGTDASLQVIIKPGAGTQLSLELRQHADGVEAQAALQHGDFKHLSQHWPELQQRLEQRGIRLAPLTDGGSFAGNGGGTFNQKQNQTGEAAVDVVQAASVTGTFAQPTARAKAPTGWETWA